MNKSTEKLPKECPVIIFRSSRKADTYLYMPTTAEFEELPEPLRKQFGAPIYVMDLVLTAERQLAQVDVLQVMQAMAEDGFFLQFPPPTVPANADLPEQLTK